MLVKSLKIKNESMFYPNDIIQLNNFDGQLLKINKREHRENNNIYYISYKINNLNEKNINFFYYLWNTIINKIKYSRGDDIMFDDNEVIIKDWNKIRFSSDIFIPNDVFINFYSLVIGINYVIQKNDEFIPEIYINE